MNEAAVQLLTDHITAGGLRHPGDDDQPAKLIPLPLNAHGLPADQAAHFAAQVGLPSNDAPRILAQAIVATLESDGGFELVPKTQLQQLQADVATPSEVNPAAPSVDVLCQHHRRILFSIPTVRAQVLMDCDLIKNRITAVHEGR